MDKIREIQRDVSLTQQEKSLKIQEIMQEQNKKNIEKISKKECDHYIRNCTIVADCCGNEYGCRLCHDHYEEHPIDRFATKKVICKKCHTTQGVSNECIACRITFGEYFCDICRLWRQKADIYHCDGCGICNMGKKELFRHCNDCKSCFPKEIEHDCVVYDGKICGVCNTSVYQSTDTCYKPKCTHFIHTNCLKNLLKNDTKCPLCKKTLIDIDWSFADELVLAQEMPEEYKKKVNIKCNDCEKESIDVDFHFLGCKCTHCGSYNTYRFSLVQNE
jgi:RING finger/CHY zinc finger protein 1